MCYINNLLYYYRETQKLRKYKINKHILNILEKIWFYGYFIALIRQSIIRCFCIMNKKKLLSKCYTCNKLFLFGNIILKTMDAIIEAHRLDREEADTPTKFNRLKNILAKF